MALITGTSDVAVNLQGHYDRNLLERALPALIHSKFAQIRPLPKNSGTRINFRRYGSLAVNTTPLTEGVTPTGKKLTSTDIYANVKQYGDFITISDWVSMTGLDPLLIEGGEILSEQMGLSVDSLDRDVYIAGTNVRYAAGVTARASVATAVAVSDVKSAIRTLEGANAKKIRSMVVGGAKVGTRPIAPAFYGITHTSCRQDYEALPGFTKVEEYASQKDIMEEEIGSWGNLRILVTTNSKIWLAGGVAVGSTGLVASDSTNIDVYSTLIFAANAVGSIPLQQGNVKNIIKKMGSAGTEDPLDQRATSGWKVASVAKILNDDFLLRIEHGCTDL
jgi:N4-gp56 family major capsid protein